MFPDKNTKSEHHHWILHIWISLGTKFQLKLTILSFWSKFAQKGYFQLNMEEVSITIEFCISDIRLGAKFHHKLTILIYLDQICPKRVFLLWNRKSEHHHWILRTWISLSKKLQVKLTKLIFWTKFARKKWTSSLNSVYLN